MTEPAEAAPTADLLPPGITPRWEWRSFGEHFGAAEEHLARLTPEREDRSEETYLLTPSGSDTVKIRGGLLDIKRLQQVDDAGLEQWKPVMKAAFPLSTEDLVQVSDSLGVDAGAPDAEVGSADDLAGVFPEVLTDGIRKHRRHFTVNGCMVELTDVTLEHGGSTRTLAVESPDPAAVRKTVAMLGLAGRPNESYPHALKRLAGIAPRRCAVIDVGTNSVKFHVAEADDGGAWRPVVDRSEITRLGEGLSDTGVLNPEPVRRTCEAIVGMAREARWLGALEIAAVGTAGMRIAPNSGDLVDETRARCDVEIEVLSGDDESRIAYLGVRAGLGEVPGSLVLFDTGGGSSQFTFGHGGEVTDRFSVDVGSVRYTEQFGLAQSVSPAQLERATAAIAADLGRLDGRPAPDAVVALGGAVTNLAAVRHRLAQYDPDIVQGTVLDLGEIDRQIELYRGMAAPERATVVGLQPKRADVILAGACIVRTVMEKLGSDAITVSDRGLRHGIVVERFGTPPAA